MRIDDETLENAAANSVADIVKELRRTKPFPLPVFTDEVVAIMIASWLVGFRAAENLENDLSENN